MEESNAENNRPRSRFRKNRGTEVNPPGGVETTGSNGNSPDNTIRQPVIQENTNKESEMVPLLPKRESPRPEPTERARSRVPSIDLPSNRNAAPEPKINSFENRSRVPSIDIEGQKPRVLSVEDDPRSFPSGGLTSNADEDHIPPEDDGDEEDDEETGLISRKRQKDALQLQPQDHLKVAQDIPGQLQRIKQLREFNSIYPLRFFLPCCKLGYNIDPLLRVAQFVDVYKNLNLAKASEGLNVGAFIKQINTFKDHIIGLVKPIVRISAINIETGYFIQSKDEAPLKPVATKGKLAVNNCSKVLWNEEIILDAPFADLVSESCILFFEIIDQRTSLSIKPNNDSNKNPNQRYNYKKVAWAFLLPIGMDGRMNIHYYLPQISPPPVSNNPEASSAPDLLRINSEETPHSIHSNPSYPPSPSQQQIAQMPFSARPSISQQYNLNNELIDNHLRLQLYDYHDFDGFVGFIQKQILNWRSRLNPKLSSLEDDAFPNEVPSIYLQWKLYKKSKIEGAFLEIAIGSRVRKPKTDETQIERDDSDSERLSPRSRFMRNRGIYGLIPTRRKRKLRVRSKDEKHRLRNTAIRRHRFPKDPCLIPDRFLQRLHVGPEGAMCIAFSHSGHLLAIASKTSNCSIHLEKQEIVYSLRLYDTDLDEEIWLDEAAHHGTIYDLKWSKNDRFLLTSSNDGTCKVWDFIAVHPLMQQYSPPSEDDNTVIHNTGGGGGTAVGSGLAGGGSPVQTQYQANFGQSPSLLHHEHFEDQSMDMSYIHYQSSLNPRSIARLYPPRIYCILRLPAKVYSYCGIFQEFISVTKGTLQNPLPPPVTYDPATNNIISNPLLDYSTWKEQVLSLQNSILPRMIIGGSDGRIRVYESSHDPSFSAGGSAPLPLLATVPAMIGLISVHDKDEHGNVIEIPPHNGSVNSLVIDERSKYLISGDSYGDILAWRLDKHQWYQLLRKFKKEVHTPTVPNPKNNNTTTPSTGNTTTTNKPPTASTIPTKYALHYLEHQHAFSHGSVLSLSMHPERNKGLMLVLSRQPSQLKVINMTTYKTLSYCENFLGVLSFLIHENDEDYSTGVFYRSSFSADGRYIICGVSMNPDSNLRKMNNSNGSLEKGLYQLIVWDTYTGHPVNTPLSNLTFPFPIRSIAWHPSQHLLAVSMIGHDAAVIVYCTNGDSSFDPNAAYNPIQQQQQPPQANVNPSGVRSSVNSLQASTDNLSIGAKSDIQYSVLDSYNTTLNTQMLNSTIPKNKPPGNLLETAARNLQQLQNQSPPPSKLRSSMDSTSSSAMTTPVVSNTRSMAFAAAKNPIIAAARPLAKPIHTTNVAEIEGKETDRAARVANARELVNKLNKKKAPPVSSQGETTLLSSDSVPVSSSASSINEGPAESKNEPKPIAEKDKEI